MDIFELKYRGSSFVVVFCCASRACNLWGLERHFFPPENAFLLLQFYAWFVLNGSSTLLFSLLLQRQEQRMKCVWWVRVHTVKRVYWVTVQSQLDDNWLQRYTFFLSFCSCTCDIQSTRKKKKNNNTNDNIKARETDARFKNETRENT